jgi:hypothetical protein
LLALEFIENYGGKLIITINPFFAKLILRFNLFSRLIIVCRGYGEDDVNFTELVWDDDKDLDFYDRDTYEEFQIWVK